MTAPRGYSATAEERLPVWRLNRLRRIERDAALCTPRGEDGTPQVAFAHLGDLLGELSALEALPTATR